MLVKNKAIANDFQIVENMWMCHVGQHFASKTYNSKSNVGKIYEEESAVTRVIFFVRVLFNLQTTCCYISVFFLNFWI